MQWDPGSPVEVGFGRFWPGFDAENDNWFLDFLRAHFLVTVSDNPEFLLYTEKSQGWARHRRVRVFYTGENIRPDMRRCDWAFSFDHLDHERHFRLPLYRLFYPPEGFLETHNPAPEPETLLNRKFCNFLYSKPGAPERVKFFDLLSRYKRVDAGGAVCNNMGERVGDKKQFLRGYKFTISFENTSYPGYTTEKIADAMVAHSLPIYWGNPVVDRDFNPASFIDAGALGSLEAAAEAVVALDKDDDAYLATMREPWFEGNVPNRYVATENIVAQFERIFSTQISPVGRSIRERALAGSARLRRHGSEVAPAKFGFPPAAAASTDVVS